jgi:hypothetical protein
MAFQQASCSTGQEPYERPKISSLLQPFALPPRSYSLFSVLRSVIFGKSDTNLFHRS